MPSMNPVPVSDSRRTGHPLWASPVAAAVVLAAFYAVLLVSLRDKSATIDEPGHAAAGYAYWTLNDYRLDPENGNLPQRWIALPYLFGAYSFAPAKTLAWKGSHSSLVGDHWFNRRGYDTAAMLVPGRAANGLLAVALGIAVWLWSRKLFGAAGGMVSLLRTCSLRL